jgi:hypothetical protein
MIAPDLWLTASGMVLAGLALAANRLRQRAIA